MTTHKAGDIDPKDTAAQPLPAKLKPDDLQGRIERLEKILLESNHDIAVKHGLISFKGERYGAPR